MKPGVLSMQRVCYRVSGPAEKAWLTKRIQAFYDKSDKYSTVGIQKPVNHTDEDEKNSVCLDWEKLEGKTLGDEYSNHRCMPLDELRDCLRQIGPQLEVLLDDGFPLRDLHPGTIVKTSLDERITQPLKTPYTLNVTSIFSKLSEVTLDAYTCLHLTPEELSAIQRDPRIPASQPGALSANDVSSAKACVYKLALLLYVLLTGNSSPFDTTETLPSQIIKQRLNQTPTLRGLPKQLRTLRPLFLRALSKDPAQRPSIDEFQREFEEIYQQIVEQRRGGPWPFDIMTTVVTRRQVIGIIITAIVLALLIPIYTLLKWLFGLRQPQTVATHKETTPESEIGDTILSFRKHSGTVSTFAPSNDGKLILSANDRRLILWQTSDGSIVLDDDRLHETSIVAVAFSNDSQILASLSEDGILWLWRRLNEEQNEVYQPFHKLCAHKPSETMFWSPTGDHVVVAFGNYLAVYDYLRDSPFFQPDSIYKGHSEPVNCGMISQDGSTAATGSYDTTVQLWSVEHARHLYTYSGHTASVSTVAFSPDGLYIASGGEDNTMQVWRAQGDFGGVLFAYPHNGAVCAAAWSFNGQHLAVGGEEGRIYLYDLNGSTSYTFPQFQAGITTLAWLPDHRIASSFGSEIRILQAL